MINAPNQSQLGRDLAMRAFMLILFASCLSLLLSCGNAPSSGQKSVEQRVTDMEQFVNSGWEFGGGGTAQAGAAGVHDGRGASRHARVRNPVLRAGAGRSARRVPGRAQPRLSPLRPRRHEFQAPRPRWRRPHRSQPQAGEFARRQARGRAACRRRPHRRQSQQGQSEPGGAGRRHAARRHALCRQPRRRESRRRRSQRCADGRRASRLGRCGG